MTDAAETKERLPPRLRRILEVVYAIEGVAEARVWEWEKSVAVGVRPMAGTFAPDLLRRVESQVVVVREPGESWTFGVLED
ncbi:MAG: hypothetical protein IPK71_04160 [Myxococcales bacterium]|jgi:hypothetical protein|nr:hypothetical protein [Myxococcales bacterium]MBL9111548.1 hypothetical protein [Myxococcales bacterium]